MWLTQGWMPVREKLTALGQLFCDYCGYALLVLLGHCHGPGDRLKLAKGTSIRQNLSLSLFPFSSLQH